MVLTISNQLVTTPGEHPVAVDGRKTRKVSLHHMRGARSTPRRSSSRVTGPLQTRTRHGFWRSSSGIWAIRGPAPSTFDDMGPSWWRFVTLRGPGR